MFYYEWAQLPNQRKGDMIPETRLPEILTYHNPGYASVYRFFASDAQRVLEMGNSRGLTDLPVYADELVIDLDNGEKDVPTIEQYIQDNGFSGSIANSGNKGYHVRIRTTPSEGKNVPFSHSKLVQSIGVEADLSLYRQDRLLALERNIHPKTQRRKTTTKTFDGSNLLTVPSCQKITGFERLYTVVDRHTLLSIALMNALAIIENEPTQGNRHNRLWQTARDLAKAGMSAETALELLSSINGSWTTPKPDDEIRRALGDAYKSLGG